MALGSGTWSQTWTPSLTHCGTLGMLFDFSESQSLHLEGGDNHVHFAGGEDE